MIRLSVPEVRKLLRQIVWGHVVDENQALDWSRWRRRHQYWAKYHHYRRRNARMPKDDIQL